MIPTFRVARFGLTGMLVGLRQKTAPQTPDEGLGGLPEPDQRGNDNRRWRDELASLYRLGAQPVEKKSQPHLTAILVEATGTAVQTPIDHAQSGRAALRTRRALRSFLGCRAGSRAQHRFPLRTLAEGGESLQAQPSCFEIQALELGLPRLPSLALRVSKRPRQRRSDPPQPRRSDTGKRTYLLA